MQSDQAQRPSSRLQRVRPGRSTHEWVRQTIAELKGNDPFAPVTLLAPNYYAGRQTRWSLARAGGYVNVRSMLIGDLAEQIVGHEALDLPPLTPVLEEAAVRAAVRQVGGAFAQVAHHRALHQSLLQLFRELRRSEISIEHPPSELARAALLAFQAYERLIATYLDRTSVRQRAARRLLEAGRTPPALAELGGLILMLPSRLDPADVQLLEAAARWLPIRAAIADFHDDEVASTLPEQVAADLTSALASAAISPNGRDP